VNVPDIPMHWMCTPFSVEMRVYFGGLKWKLKKYQAVKTVPQSDFFAFMSV
jgi:hypothetical protein